MDNLSRLRYFGDIKLKDLASPRTAKKSWSIIKSTVSTLRKRIINLQQSRRRLKSRITNTNSLMKYLREQRLITENAESAIEVRKDFLSLMLICSYKMNISQETHL
ncbi:hypothetical protein NQ314_015574 [Rhamnusium bicolor]|uniref:Uncharacterized protein n=1 Tax=Rhamnusium bicolor TaxID=1586634 RepID=A0AAV8WYH4_9CUCU|nr:hypothetical protein NQ314_015574 [Rhamnusium bicolor]